MNYSLYVDKSSKGNVYCYLDLGYSRKFLDINLVAELLCVPVSSIYSYDTKTKLGTLKIEK